MKSLYCPVKNLVYIPILAIQFLLIRSVTALNLTNSYLHHKCLVSEGQYQPGSEYEKNLNHIIRLFSSYNFQDGFRHTTHGEAPNSITVVIQCRGDSYGPNCRSCFTTAVTGLRGRCQRNKGAIIWYDQCLLHVSTIKSRSPKKIDYENSFSMYNPNNMSVDTNLVNKKIKEFLHKLMLKANTSPLVYYAVGEERLGTKKLYAMVQCTKDTFSCGDCLKWSINELSKCCDGKQGARVLGTSCNLRYELYPFLRT